MINIKAINGRPKAWAFGLEHDSPIAAQAFGGLWLALYFQCYSGKILVHHFEQIAQI